MKRLLFILMLFTSIPAFAQEAAPVGADWKTVSFALWKYNPILRMLMGYKNTTDMWSSFVSQPQIKAKIDSLAVTIPAPPQSFEIEVSANGVTSYTIPFALKSTSLVWVNGNMLKNNQWSGVGGTTLSLSITTNIYDFLKIKN